MPGAAAGRGAAGQVRARAPAGAERKIDLAGPAAADMADRSAAPWRSARSGRRDCRPSRSRRERECHLRAAQNGTAESTFCLRFGAQIDQQVAAGDQIEARERRIGQHVLDREDDHPAQLGHHPVAMVLLGKEAGEPRRRHIRRDRFRVDALAGESDRILVDIGSEDLQS